MVDGLRFSRRARQARDQGKVSGAEFGADAGLGLQSAPAAVQGRAGAPRLQLCLRFRGDEPAACRPASTIATAAISTASPTSWRPDFPRASNWKFWNRCATRCLPEVFTTPYKNPVGGNPGSRPQQSARSDAAAEGGRLRNPRPQAGRSRRASRSASRFLSPTRATSGSRCSTSRRWSGSASP